MAIVGRCAVPVAQNVSRDKEGPTVEQYGVVAQSCILRLFSEQQRYLTLLVDSKGKLFFSWTTHTIRSATLRTEKFSKDVRIIDGTPYYYNTIWSK